MVKFLRKYCSAYGGILAIISSSYFWASVPFALVSGYYSSDSQFSAEKIVSIFPNVIGFSLGTFALLFSINNSRLVRLLSETEVGERYSLYEKAAATFAHFIFFQVIAIILAIFSFSLPEIQREFVIGSIKRFGFFKTFQYYEYTNIVLSSYKYALSLLLFYCLLLAVAATSSVFSLVSMHSTAISSNETRNRPKLKFRSRSNR